MADDWRSAAIDAPTRALLEYAEKVTRTPFDTTERDIEALRGHGLSDAAIHDAVQVIAYFNYINRVASALGCELERPLGAGES